MKKSKILDSDSVDPASNVMDFNKSDDIRVRELEKTHDGLPSREDIINAYLEAISEINLLFPEPSYIKKDHKYTISSSPLGSLLVEPENNTSQEPSPISGEQAEDNKRPEFLNALLTKKSKSLPYEDRVRELEGRKLAFDREFAAQFLEALKLEMQNESRKHATIEEKRLLVDWVNSEVKSMGLTFRNPKVDRSAMLVVDTGNNPDVGRFQLRTEADDTGTGKTETFSTPKLSSLLAKLELMSIPPRREGWVEYRRKKAEGQGGGASPS